MCLAPARSRITPGNARTSLTIRNASAAGNGSGRKAQITGGGKPIVSVPASARSSQAADTACSGTSASSCVMTAFAVFEQPLDIVVIQTRAVTHVPGFDAETSPDGCGQFPKRQTQKVICSLAQRSVAHDPSSVA
jgi:hypothetical protein